MGGAADTQALATALEHAKGLANIAKEVGSAADALKLVDGIRLAAECVRDIYAERGKQEAIRLAAAERVRQIDLARDAVLGYLDRSFDERRENFARLFDALDRAMEARDPALVGQVLNSVVSLAQSSPFKDLADVASARAAFEAKKEFVF